MHSPVFAWFLKSFLESDQPDLIGSPISYSAAYLWIHVTLFCHVACNGQDIPLKINFFDFSFPSGVIWGCIYFPSYKRLVFHLLNCWVISSPSQLRINQGGRARLVPELMIQWISKWHDNAGFWNTCHANRLWYHAIGQYFHILRYCRSIRALISDWQCSSISTHQFYDFDPARPCQREDLVLELHRHRHPEIPCSSSPTLSTVIKIITEGWCTIFWALSYAQACHLFIVPFSVI